MRLILAEKPNVAASIAAMLGEITLSTGEVLQTAHLTNAKYERLIKEARKNGYFESQNYIITYAYGHLFTLKEPQEMDPNLSKWKWDTLPFSFQQNHIKAIDSPTNKQQISVLKKLFHDKRVTDVVVATDAGREGELIFRLIYQELKSQLPFSRMWIKDQTETGLRTAYQQMKPGMNYNGLADAARCRQEADWLVGMNLSRAMSLKYGGFQNVLSIGRVQTPTLAMLVNRELEIQQFNPDTFYTLKATFIHANGNYEAQWFHGKKDQFKSKSEGEKIKKIIEQKSGVLQEATRKEEKEKNPLLYDLSELQRVMSKSHGYSASQTLDIAQSLYDDHKLITYPRTSSQYISTGTGKAVRDVLTYLKPVYSSWVQNAGSFASFIIDDSKTSDHEAIIPTQKTPQLKRLTPQELAVYEAVVKRFIAAFYPICIWEQTQTITLIEGHTFKANGKMLKQAGWRTIEGIPSAVLLPFMNTGDHVTTQATKFEQKKTQPPKRLDDGDIIRAMETAGKLIDNDQLKLLIKEAGIGTPATRAAIIEELIKRGYVKREKKHIVPTEKGISLIQCIPVKELTSPELTAKWEQDLLMMEKGLMDRTNFMNQLCRTIEQMVATIKGVTKQKIIMNCPHCSGFIIESEKWFGCTNKDIMLWKNAAFYLGKSEITTDEAQALLTHGKTNDVVDLFSKAKQKSYKAYLLYDGKKITIQF